MDCVEIKYAGWDSGYDTCKIIDNIMYEEGKQPLLFPSLAKQNSSGLIDESQLGVNEEFSKERMIIEVKDKDDTHQKFMVGEYILNQLEVGGTNYSVEKYRSTQELAKLLSGFSALYPKANRIYVDTLVMGLPIQQHKMHKDEMKSRFTGEFEAYINGEKGQKKVKYIFKNVEVIPQAAAALVYYNFKNQDFNFAQSRIALVDVGGRTIDGLAYNMGQLIKESPFSSNIGMSNVFRRVSQETGIDENTIRDAVISGENNVTYNQQEKNITTHVNQASDDVSQEIVAFTQNAWRDFVNKINKVLIMGGSSKILVDYIKSHFGSIKVELIDNPQIANVLGYLLRAQAIYQKHNPAIKDN